MQSRSFRYSAIMIAAVLLSACGKGDSDLRAWIDDIKAKPGAQIDPLPVMAKFPNFEYAAQGMRDPFSTGTPEADDANGAISAKTLLSPR